MSWPTQRKCKPAYAWKQSKSKDSCNVLLSYWSELEAVTNESLGLKHSLVTLNTRHFNSSSRVLEPLDIGLHVCLLHLLLEVPVPQEVSRVTQQWKCTQW